MYTDRKIRLVDTHVFESTHFLPSCSRMNCPYTTPTLYPPKNQTTTTVTQNPLISPVMTHYFDLIPSRPELHGNYVSILENSFYQSISFTRTTSIDPSSHLLPDLPRSYLRSSGRCSGDVLRSFFSVSELDPSL